MSLPVGMYDSGKIRISFPKLQNVEIYLNGGKSRSDAKIEVTNAPPNKSPITEPSDSVSYELDLKHTLFVTVLPIKNKEQTLFTISYQLADLPTLSWYMQLYQDYYKQYLSGEDGFKAMIVFAVCLGCLLILYCAICCMGIKHCKNRKKEDEQLRDTNKVNTLDVIKNPP